MKCWTPVPTGVQSFIINPRVKKLYKEYSRNEEMVILITLDSTTLDQSKSTQFNSIQLKVNF